MLLLTAVFWTSSKRFHYCKRFIDVRARQEKNHWQSCWTDGKPDRNIISTFTLMKLRCKSEILRGQIKNHSHATHLICIFAKTFVVNFDPFLLFIDFANFSFIQMVALSHFILNTGHARHCSVILNLELRIRSEGESLDASSMITEYQMFIDVWPPVAQAHYNSPEQHYPA